jgi:hypothetical protein
MSQSHPGVPPSWFDVLLPFILYLGTMVLGGGFIYLIISILEK